MNQVLKNLVLPEATRTTNKIIYLYTITASNVQAHVNDSKDIPPSIRHGGVAREHRDGTLDIHKQATTLKSNFRWSISRAFIRFSFVRPHIISRASGGPVLL